MPNTRKKLIELLGKTPGIGWSDSARRMVADHLIANGVTLQNHDCHWATEQAYKNGYEQGKKDMENSIKSLLTEILSVARNAPTATPLDVPTEWYGATECAGT